MTALVHTFLSFDVGEKRIGVAQADSGVRVPFPVTTLVVDGLEYTRIRQMVSETDASVLVVGYPRNQSGEPTAQTEVSVAFAERLKAFGVPVVFQDESLTSVMAEGFLKQSKKPYSKGDIDAQAAAILLGDYLERTYGH